jgi:hypothetical protein
MTRAARHLLFRINLAACCLTFVAEEVVVAQLRRRIGPPLAALIISSTSGFCPCEMA